MVTNDLAPVITIDGPGGSGKGTIARAVAHELGWHLLDSGALYRLVALGARSHSIEPENEPGLVTLAAHLDVQFHGGGQQDGVRIVFEGDEVQDILQTEEIGNLASRIAAIPAVRTALLARQRAFREDPGLVCDGRDMGTVIFPDAGLKVFLTASPEERAERRYKQLKLKGLDVNLAALAQEIAERDERDRNRPVAPLIPAEDAHLIDSTGMSIDQVVQKVLSLLQ